MTAEIPTYEEILARKPPHPIRTEEEADRVREEIQALARTHPRSPGEEEYLSLLSQLLIAWEHGRYEPPHLPGFEVLRCLLEDNDLPQAALVGPVFASRSIVSEILSGRRKLTLNHIQKLAEFFHTRPEVFLS
jgi:HTH-type transcriptional regulator / antitoxin HigA